MVGLGGARRVAARAQNSRLHILLFGEDAGNLLQVVEAGGQVQKDVWQLANASAITSALLLISIFMTFWESSRIHLGKAQ